MFNMKVMQRGDFKTIWKIEPSKGTVCLKLIRISIHIAEFTTVTLDFLFSKGSLIAGTIPTER